VPEERVLVLPVEPKAGNHFRRNGRFRGDVRHGLGCGIFEMRCYIRALCVRRHAPENNINHRPLDVGFRERFLINAVVIMRIDS
jgi:hypothetical protein